MNDNIVDLQFILEENNRLDSYFESDSEIDIFHHQLRNIAYYNHLIASDNIGDDNSELLDLG